MIGGGALRDLAAAACFAVFLAGCLLAGTARPESGSSRTRATWFTLYVLLVTFAVGLSGRDLYPFSPWNLIAWLGPDSLSLPRLAVVGADGREYAVDYRAWRPLAEDELYSWIDDVFLVLDTTRKDEAGAWLLDRVDAASERARSGRVIGAPGRILGPLGAPYFHLHPARWARPGSVPPSPLRALRLYQDTWGVEERARDPAAVRRNLVYEYRR